MPSLGERNHSNDRAARGPSRCWGIPKCGSDLPGGWGWPWELEELAPELAEC